MSRRPIETMLLIEDNPGDARLIRDMFKEQTAQNIELKQVERMADAEKFLALRLVDIIILDLGLPDVEGLDAVRRARKAAPGVPLVVLSGLDDESMALQAMQEGAQDYLIKGETKTRELVRAVRYAVERKIIEETLFEEKKRAEATLDCIGDAVISTDVSGNIIFLNAVAEKSDGLVFERGGWPADGGCLSHCERFDSQDCPESDGENGRAKSDTTPPIQHDPHPARWNGDIHRRLSCPDSRSRWAGCRVGHCLSRYDRGAVNGRADRSFR